ncbi:hypothetical protein HYFRA_00002688 [Hymenoscyphus fraxineus]|uniref:Rhodopsin domain-containing protein n=1 Tax=Hymenoscyphus fraxineus TaxID=746836 RepID=A0A9N9PZ76_9HELO|nr:hypothetical protein HYFRA_00002688 [Hymenoscyphus fraxineus]
MIMTVREARYGMGKPNSERTLGDTENFMQSLYLAIIFYNVSLSTTKFAIILQYMRVFTTGRVKFWCKVSIWVVIVAGVDYYRRYVASAAVTSAVEVGFAEETEDAVDGNIFAWRICAFIVNTASGMWSVIEVNVGIICACLQTLRPLMARVFPNLFASTNLGPRGYGNSNKIASRGGIQSGSNTREFEMERRSRIDMPLPNKVVTTANTSTENLRGGDDSEGENRIMVTKSIDVKVEDSKVPESPYGMV